MCLFVTVRGSDLVKKLDSVSGVLKVVPNCQTVTDAANVTADLISEFLSQVWLLLLLLLSLLLSSSSFLLFLFFTPDQHQLSTVIAMSELDDLEWPWTAM